MKTILSIIILTVAVVATGQAQNSGDYKHPYGLTQTRKSQKAAEPLSTERKEEIGIKRNYKNPQADKGEVVIATPGNKVEVVVNPLVAEDNYKRQNRNTEAENVVRPKQTDMMVQDSLNRKNNKKD